MLWVIFVISIFINWIMLTKFKKLEYNLGILYQVIYPLLFIFTTVFTSVLFVLIID